MMLQTQMLRMTSGFERSGRSRRAGLPLLLLYFRLDRLGFNRQRNIQRPHLP